MSGQDDHARAQALEEFKLISKLDDNKAIEYLEAANWDLGSAAQAFYNDEDPPTPPSAAAGSAVPDNYTGPRTLSGQPAPHAASSSSSSRRPQQQPKRKGVATLGSLASSSHNHDDDDDSDDDEDDDGRDPRDLFAGGEKSGLAVQDPKQSSGNPKKIIGDILAKAKANASRPDADEDAGPGPSRVSNLFRGTGMTLGGDGVESRAIPDPTAAPGTGPGESSGDEAQERVLHLWHDGFSIDGGPLHRFDDPANSADLNMIRAGRAPLHLMNVRYDQPVDVKLNQHDENYRRLPEYFDAFAMGGRRLGSDVPGDGNTAAAAPVATTTAAPAASSGPTTGVDESQPTITLRIQLPDGTRLPARFNTSQTVDDIYQFIQRAMPANQGRQWVVATTFPNKEHTDRDLVLGEMSEFKKGGTAVVKWA